MNKDVEKAIEVLQTGGVIAYPTDTIWGLGCDATNPEAVNKVYALKQRDDSKALIVLIESEEQLKNYVADLPEKALDAIGATKRPLTIIYPRAKGFAPNLMAEDGSIAIRIPNDDFCQRLLRQFGKPIVSTSANISGKDAPKYFSQIAKVLLDATDYVVNYRRDDKTPSLPSKIIKFSPSGEEIIIRA